MGGGRSASQITMDASSAPIIENVIRVRLIFDFCSSLAPPPPPLPSLGLIQSSELGFKFDFEAIISLRGWWCLGALGVLFIFSLYLRARYGGFLRSFSR